LKKQVRTTFTDRRQDAMEAKQRLLDKMKAAPKADDPEMIAKRAEREAVAAARDERRAERERAEARRTGPQGRPGRRRCGSRLCAEHAEAIAREADEAARAERAVADMAAMKEKRDQALRGAQGAALRPGNRTIAPSPTKSATWPCRSKTAILCPLPPGERQGAAPSAFLLSPLWERKQFQHLSR
jgi:hypothetical protein